MELEERYSVSYDISRLTPNSLSRSMFMHDLGLVDILAHAISMNSPLLYIGVSLLPFLPQSIPVTTASPLSSSFLSVSLSSSSSSSLLSFTEAIGGTLTVVLGRQL